MDIPTLNTTATLEQRRLDPDTGVPINHQDRYLIPDPRTTGPQANGKRPSWQRATNLAAMLSDRFALEKGDQNKIILGLGARPDLQALAVAAQLKGGTDRKLLQQIREQALAAGGADVKANQGTAFHAFAELIDAGRTDELEGLLRGDLGEHYGPMVCAYRNMVARYDIQVPTGLDKRFGQCSELVFHNPAIEVAGRTDAIRVIDGELVICDVKTGQDPGRYSQLEIGIQLALAANAPYIWLEEYGMHAPMPPVSKDVAYVFHVPSGGDYAELIKVDIRKAWGYVELAVKVREARKDDALFWNQGRVGAEESWNRQAAAPPAPDSSRVKVLVQNGIREAYGVPDALAPAPMQVEQGPPAATTPDPAPGGSDQATDAPIPGGKLVLVAGEQLTLRQLGERGLDGIGEQLADPKAPGARGCGACGRVGHKRGNARCLGDQDPIQLGTVRVADSPSGPVTVPIKYADDETAEREAGKLPPDPAMVELGMRAAAGELNEQPPAPTAAQKLADIANTAPPWCTCAMPAAGQFGWVKRPDGIYLHKEPGGCGLPSWAATQRAAATGVATAPGGPTVIAQAAQAAQWFTSNPAAQPPESVMPWPPAAPAARVLGPLERILNAGSSSELTAIVAEYATPELWTQEIAAAASRRQYEIGQNA